MYLLKQFKFTLLICDKMHVFAICLFIYIYFNVYIIQLSIKIDS